MGVDFKVSNSWSFLLGRLEKKSSLLSNEQIIESLKNSPEILYYNKKYSIIAHESNSIDDIDYLVGALYKYNEEINIKKFNADKKREDVITESNAIESKSLFVYIPKYSGICFQEDGSNISRNTFRKIFTRLIDASNDFFFSSLEINYIKDINKFIDKLKTIDRLELINATVVPPNPKYGRLWKPLYRYIIRRGLEKLRHIEKSDQGIHTNLNSPDFFTKEEIPEIGDAVVAMSLDGYGSATLKGKDKTGRLIKIRSSEDVASFETEQDIPPDILFKTAREKYMNIESERYMSNE